MADRRTLVRGFYGVEEAAQISGLSPNTIRRRVDAWINGVRTTYALKGDRADGHRRVDAKDLMLLTQVLDGSPEALELRTALFQPGGEYNPV